MSDFLTELRGEVLDAHAAHARRSGPAAALRRLRAQLGIAPLLALPAAVCLLALLVVLARDAPRTEPQVAAQIRIGGAPTAAAYADGSLWVADYTARQLVQVDAASRKVVDRFALDGTPEAIASGPDGALWVRVGRDAGDETILTRIDTRTGRATQRVRVGPDVPLAVTPAAVWAAVLATDDDRPREGLYRLDVATGTTRRLPVAGIGRLAADDAALWALRTNGDLLALDPVTGARRRVLRTLVPAAGATAGQHALAVTDNEAWVLSTTPAGHNRLARVRDGDEVSSRRADPRLRSLLAADGRRLWSVVEEAHGRGYALVALDAATAAITASVDLGADRPIAVQPAAQGVWVVSAAGTVSLITSRAR